MNVSQIKMPFEEAKAAFREYRDAVKKNPDPEHEELAIAYKAIADGKAVVDALAAFKTAGLDEYARPRLAMARADVKQITYNCYQQNSVPCFDKFPQRSHRGRYAQTQFALPAGFYTKGVALERWTAVVPIIPPRFAPPKSLVRKYWVMFEPEWTVAPRQRDPLLLREISRYLYVVVAAWDMTELELSILSRRME